MNMSRIVRKCAAVAGAGAAAAIALAPIAWAQEDKPAAEPEGIIALREEAETEVEREAVEALAEALVEDPELADIATYRTPFAYDAPTIGCGVQVPLSLTAASAVTSDTNDDVKARQIMFQALANTTGTVQSSGMTVAWININTGASGFDPLDGKTKQGYPAVNRVVETGSGTVIAVLAGTIGYNNSLCVVMPTVGSFFVPDTAPLPSELTEEELAAAQQAEGPAPVEPAEGE
jgi:hypothetical protein